MVNRNPLILVIGIDDIYIFGQLTSCELVDVGARFMLESLTR